MSLVVILGRSVKILIYLKFVSSGCLAEFLLESVLPGGVVLCFKLVFGLILNF